MDDAFIAWLICRDELAGRMDRRDARITLNLLRGKSQRKIGHKLGIDQSAVAGRLKRNGAYAILMARERLEAIAKGEGWPGGPAVRVDPVRSPGAGGEKPGTAPGAGGKPGSSPGAGGSKPGSAPGVGGGKPGVSPGVGNKPGKAG